ncbi:hypothetical protein [Dokdonia sp. Hel_I_53]|uniref:hypothetical protein n=1 Tax=Dokdonia sp. Hel_I_53 TaxID=1566287 RepID=UPI00119B8CF6|nr:hypothetical protein [Dokdonia sp. Hel_I_53]TVZ52817.1 hypothetical protein OD90_2001 [Dokdonia sp. Hel_I_53]
MPTSLITFYTAPLQCNCPQCFSTSGLELSFKQEWKDTLWRKQATPVVREELYCKLCTDTIYPVKWTDDIERVYEYHLKRAEKVVYNKWKPLAFILILFGIAILSILIYLVVNR